MNLFMRYAALSLIILGSAALPGALGQPPSGNSAANPNARPTVSPYLNLLRRGASPGVNYYGLVRPEFEFRSAVRGIYSQLDSRVEQGLDSRGIPETGHATSFLDTRGYFLNISPPNRGGPRAAAAGPAAAQSSSGVPPVRRR